MAGLDAEAIWRSLETDDTAPRFDAQRSQSLLEAREAFLAEGNFGRAQECAIEAAVFSAMRTRFDDRPVRYAHVPVSHLVEKWKNALHVPEEVASYLRHRSTTASSPILRSRFADFLWDRVGVPADRVNAAQALLDSVPIYAAKGWEVELFDCLTRCRWLAEGHQPSEWWDEYDKGVLTAIRELARRSRWAEVAAFARLLRTSSSAALITEVLETLATGLEHLRQQEAYEGERAVLEALVLLHLWRSETEEVRTGIEDTIKSYLKQADCPTTKPTLAATNYRQAMLLCRQFGKDQLLRDLEQRHGQLAEESIEKDLLEWIANPAVPQLKETPEHPLQATSVSSALRSIGRCLFPRKVDIEGSLQLRLTSPLHDIFTPVKVNGDGNITVMPQSESDRTDLSRGEVWAEHASYVGSLLLTPLLDRLITQGLDADTIVSHLMAAPAFGEQDRSLLDYGVKCLLSGDSTGSIHVLLPQFEAAVRGLLHAHQIPTTASGRENPFVMKEKALHNLLEEPVLEELLGADALTYLRMLYVDPRSVNLRNEITHGLCHHPTTRTTGMVILQSLLLLAACPAPSV